jgi:hypothetical protein
MARLPTIKIQRGDGYVIINESDFDPERHTRYGDAPEPAKKAAKGGDPVSEGSVAEVEHTGGGWYVVRIGDAFLRGEGGEPVKFKGSDAAQAALDEYRAAQE